MAASILDQIFTEYGAPESVRFRDVQAVTKLVELIANGGADKLQVITDFDFTLSKAHADGKKCTPAADIIRQSQIMPDEFRTRARERYRQLLPIELNTSLTNQQKIPAVISSFEDAFADLISTGLLSRDSLAAMIADANDSFQLRDRCSQTLQSLHDAKVPVLIFSAGFGDIVQGVLQRYGLNYPNIHVLSNFMKFSEVDGKLIGFKKPLIHTFNKNESVVPKDCEYFNEIAQRSNIILLGDMIGDVTMAEGVHTTDQNVLKIGFLNEVDDQQLDSFLENFDIVLMDDQTMDFVNCLLVKIF